MREKWTMHISVIVVFVFFIVLVLACESMPGSSQEASMAYKEIPFSELKDRRAQGNSQWEGFIVEAYIKKTAAPGDFFEIASDLTYTDTEKNCGVHRLSDTSGFPSNHINSKYVELYNQILRFDANKKYRIYICVCDRYDDGRRFSYIDKVEGLFEDHAVIAAREKAESEAADEAERQERAQERANASRRVQENLIIGPSNFSPSGYANADLFAAVAASERLQAYLQPGTYEELDLFGVYSRKFASDVIFVSQSGTDVVFRAEDNAIRKSMKVDSRTGLTVGQKVRIYYTIYRIKDWRVEAIERL